MRLLASRRGERRQRVEPGVQLHHRRLRPPALDSLPIGGRRGVVAQHREGSLRVGVGDHDRGADQLTALDLDPLAREDPRHRDAGGNRGAALLRRLGDRERDPPHAALDIAPHRPPPQQVALVVHQPHRGRAGVAGPGEGADHALAEERVLDALVVDVAVEGLGDRLLEHDRDRLVVVAQELLQLRAGRGGAHPGIARPGAKHPAQPLEQLFVGVKAPDVPLREAVLTEVGGGALPIDEQPHRAAIGQRAPQVGVGHQDPVAVALELELADHQAVEQADDVGAGADQVARVRKRLLQRARSADPLPSLEHQHRAAGSRQIGGSREPVVPPADHDRVPVPGGQLAERGRQPDLAHARRHRRARSFALRLAHGSRHQASGPLDLGG